MSNQPTKYSKKYQVSSSIGPYFDSAGEMCLRQIHWKPTWEPTDSIDTSNPITELRNGVYDDFIIEKNRSNTKVKIAWRDEYHVRVKSLLCAYDAAVTVADIERWKNLAVLRHMIQLHQNQKSK